jgi:hypothetical protein
MAVFAANGPSIQFNEKMFDFGNINEADKTASHVFTFKNTGNAPLIIHKAVASCGCTTPEYPEQPIIPGATGDVKVTYNTVGRPNAFQKTITIYSNDTENPTVVLIIKGDVRPDIENPELAFPRNMQGLRLSKTQVSMLDTKIGSIRSERIDIVNTNSKPISLSFRKIPPHIRLAISSSVLQPKETGFITLKYFASEAKDYGRRDDSFYVVLNKDIKSSAQNAINVSAYITEDFSQMSQSEKASAPIAEFSENRPNFGKMTQNGKKSQSVTLTNKGKTPLIIRKIVPEYDGIKVIPEKTTIPPGKTIKLKIDFNAGTFNGNVVQRITIFTNDPKNSITRLFVLAQVSPDGK